MFSHPSTFIKLHHLVLILRQIFVWKCEKVGTNELHNWSIEGISQGAAGKTSDAEKMALVPLASPSGSSQGQRAQELKPTIRLGTELRTHLHLSGQSWTSLGHRNDLGALPLAQH